MTFTIEPLGPDSKKQHISDESRLSFGRYFKDRMLLVEWRAGQGWFDARIKPYEPFTLDPSCMVFHFAREIFEGLKAYK